MFVTMDSRVLDGMNAEQVCRLADEFGVTVQALRNTGRGVYVIFQGEPENIESLRWELDGEDY